MKTQIEVAKHRLYDDNALGAVNVKLFPGTVREISQEMMAEQVNKAISQIETGDFDLIEEDCD